MKLPNWFKIMWWALITIAVSVMFYFRLEFILKGQTVPVDIFIFLVLVALLFVPIFQEVSFFGLKFKQIIDEFQKQINVQLSTFKADIQTSLNNSINTNVHILSNPPSDDKLPDIELKIKETLNDILGDNKNNNKEQGEDADIDSLLTVQNKTQFLFRVRYLIEKNLREIGQAFDYQSFNNRPMSITRLTKELIYEQIINSELAMAIREVYSVCSFAIHGNEFSEKQFHFVRDLGPDIVKTLEKIRAEQGV